MFARGLLLALCALAVSATPVVVRDSVVSLPVARRFNNTGSANILEIDQARAAVLRAGALSGTTRSGSAVQTLFTDPATNSLVDYTVQVGVGSPATEYTLLVDTGSSNTWIGADKAYTKTSTSKDTGDRFSLLYGSGLVIGEEYTDTVTLGSSAIKGQSIGVASIAIGFSGVDGILGVGPTDLTSGTAGSGTVPTVTDNLASQGLISSKVLGVSFEPTTSESSTNGELDFGGTDSSKYTGSISYVPITSTSPASEYVGIDQSVTYGTGTSILSTTAGIVDTGTTLTLLASDALAKYQSATGAVSDRTTGLLRITSAQYNNLKSLFYKIGDTTYEFTANAQIWPRALNSAIGGSANDIYLIVGDLGSDSGSGLDFINGLTWLERFYFVYDASNSQVGFATTQFTDATTN